MIFSWANGCSGAIGAKKSSLLIRCSVCSSRLSRVDLSDHILHHKQQMEEKWRIIVAVVLALGILVLFVLPAYDVPPTAMRAWQAARVLAMAMSFQAVLSLTRAIAASLHYDVFFRTPGSPNILDLTCTRLC